MFLSFLKLLLIYSNKLNIFLKGFAEYNIKNVVSECIDPDGIKFIVYNLTLFILAFTNSFFKKYI